MNGHDWQRVRFVPKMGEPYFGRHCRSCGLRTYLFGRLTRWRYPDGRVHDTATIDEPTCAGQVPCGRSDCTYPSCGCSDTRREVLAKAMAT